MVSRKIALFGALTSGIVIAILYWIIQHFLRLASPWMVGLIVFVVAYLGMRGWKI